ncbi:DNA-3-methyladenine glycosylase [Paraburkholderia bonniea]|uniref:DNA-3-methyladenine glycosylase family protein n=1 Tax=Paraburkholderia bonniea TaxID=2152891 RepID=UPI0012915AE0|nr:DNA-3-methyladenine glycosylase [Paraburkholderia bonniea]WJF91233.1 DNA-3-methyladenine glycosylase [Paraburkholderia bonniea]WJF94548.1 DNA-3-methyladenine glycosylase [Paraburkholderia bonniea]
MVTATKTPVKRTASKTGAAAAKKTPRARGAAASKAAAGEARLDTARAVPNSAADAVVAANETAQVTRAVANAAAKAEVKAAASRPAARVSRAKGNGALPEAGSGTEVAVPVQLGGSVPEIVRPAYWDKACGDLVKRDRILKKLIPKFGPVHLLSRGDPFVTLARSVVGQQISVASAQAVWQRIETACPRLAPQQVIKLGHDKLMACGLSKRKTEYILDLARHFVSGALHVGKWTSMDDEAVIAELTQIRGIGRWTAEMFLIFNLSRPNVLPLDDLGLIRAISVNYFSGEPVTRSEAREVAANWEPWRTVATWYMWRSLDPLPVDY